MDTYNIYIYIIFTYTYKSYIHTHIYIYIYIYKYMVYIPIDPVIHNVTQQIKTSQSPDIENIR